MKSEQKEYTIIKKYWTCLNDGHKHELENAANNCIAKSMKVKVSRNRWTKENRAELLSEFRSGGMTKKALADKYQLSSSRIAVVLARAEREEERERERAQE